MDDAINQLLTSIREEAAREEFPIDEKVYESANLDKLTPILYYGSLTSKVCFFARDLGKDEVHARQPLYGAAGRLVRKGIHNILHNEETNDAKKLEQAAQKVLLTNTVPYKPTMNKAYSTGVKKRFRPFLETLLTKHWQGDYIITLGNEAFKWFIPYGNKKEMEAFFKEESRYANTIDVSITSKSENSSKKITLAPLPHPSPLNQKYYALFPELLHNRLDAIKKYLI